jgi:hypothetical protein
MPSDIAQDKLATTADGSTKDYFIKTKLQN